MCPYRDARIGGCIRVDRLAVPGCVRDVMATTFVLFVTSPADAALGSEPERRGLAFAAAHPRPGRGGGSGHLPAKSLA